MKREVIKVVTIALAILITSNFNLVWANDNSLQEQLDKNNQQLEDLKNEKEEVSSEINKEQRELKELESKISSKSDELEKAKAEVDKYQVDIDLLQSEIDNVNYEINEVESDIKIKEDKISSLILEQENKAALLTDRIRNYYKIDVSSQYMYILLKSESIYEAFNNLTYIWRVIKLDKKLIDEAKAKEDEIKNEKEKLDIILKEQINRREDVLIKQEEIVKQQKEFLAKKEVQANMLYELQGLESEKSSLIESLVQQGNNLESKIGDLIAYNKEIQQKLDDLINDLNNGSDTNKPPISQDVEYLRPSSGYITDTFGPRINPVTGQAGMHNGIDYAAGFDAPIVASKSGIVEYAGWITGYGNTIIINHGGGVQTLYAHANSLVGWVGQSVAQGELIAYVGSTGMSTGPHLHFEIRINGKAVDPYRYIPY